MRRSEYAGERLLLTLWVGSLWAIGFLAVPVAFSTLDSVTAADFAAILFQLVSYLGLFCGAILIATKLMLDRATTPGSWRFWILILMVSATLVLTVYLLPEMAQLRQMMIQADTELSQRFDRLHVISENLYLLLSVLGLLLVMTSDKTHQLPSEGQDGPK
ncbi:MAG: DUF4149 domain-containing protein [Methylophaga sp.]|nr:DUF4149 domain-containing protein [Methylophaga sp.]